WGRTRDNVTMAIRFNPAFDLHQLSISQQLCPTLQIKRRLRLLRGQFECQRRHDRPYSFSSTPSNTHRSTSAFPPPCPAEASVVRRRREERVAGSRPSFQRAAQ